MPSELVVVGLDGSPNSKAAARWAVGEGRLRGAKVEFVTAFGMRAPHHLPGRTALVTDRELALACARMQAAAAEEADLLVPGSRGHGGIAGLRLGSVSVHCIQRAACPVVVVPAIVADTSPRHRWWWAWTPRR